MTPTPFEGQAVWYSKDYKNNEEWIHKISEEDEREIEEALKVWRQSGVDYASISRETFPLKNLGAVSLLIIINNVKRNNILHIII